MSGKHNPQAPGATFPSERAFVVHFHSTARSGPSAAGRAEHLSSGRTTDFATLSGLHEFFAQFLEAPRARRKGTSS